MGEWLEFSLAIASVVVVAALLAAVLHKMLGRGAVVSVLLAAVATGLVLAALFYWIDGGTYWVPLSVVFVVISVEALLPAAVTVWLLRRRLKKSPDT